MSDPIAKQIDSKRKELEALLEKQAERLPAIEEFLKTAKKVEGVDTSVLESLLKQAKSVLGAAGVKTPKETEKSE